MIYSKEELKKRSEETSQKFSDFIPEYVYDEVNKVVLKVGEINQQEVVDSSKDCAFDRILNRYLETGIAPIGSSNIGVKAKTRAVTPIDSALQLQTMLDKYKDYGVETVDDLIKFKDNIDIVLKEYQESLKEVKDEKETLNEVESKDIHANGSKN